MPILKIHAYYWRDGSVVKSASSSCRDPEFCSQHPLGSLQLPVILASGNLMACSGCLGHLHSCAYTPIYILMQNLWLYLDTLVQIFVYWYKVKVILHWCFDEITVKLWIALVVQHFNIADSSKQCSHYPDLCPLSYSSVTRNCIPSIKFDCEVFHFLKQL